MATDVDFSRRALAEIGTRTSISSLSDGSPEATYCNLLYNPLRDFLLREGDYDWAMLSVDAVETFNAVDPWTYTYAYPENIIRVRQALPLDYNPLDPVPVEWNIFALSDVRQIGSKQQIGSFLCTYPAPEDYWDAIFQEAFVRLLASALAFALENRIEASKKALEESVSFARIADMRQR